MDTKEILSGLRVFVHPAAVDTPAPRETGKEVTESDEFYELTADDYARLVSHKKEDKSLKTKHVRQAELASRRARIPKAKVRVQFPDEIVLEAEFKSSDRLVELLELLKKVLLKPEIPFRLYTTPPKRDIVNYNISMYEAGFAPGGLVHFTYETADLQGPYLREDVLALQYVVPEQPKSPAEVEAEVEERPQLTQPPATETPRPTVKDNSKKPKWLKLGK